MNPTPTAAPAKLGTPAEAIATIHQARRERWAASAREFMAVAAFADHYLDPDETPMVPGTERMLHWAGEGAPAVAEFCSLELMAALRISDAAAITLIRDSLGACQMVCVSRTERNGKNHDHDRREEAGRW